METTQAKAWLSPGDVAAELRVPVRSVRGGVMRKRLAWVRAGRHLRIARSDLEAGLRAMAEHPLAEV